MPTQFNHAGGFAGFGNGIGVLRRKQVSGDGEFNPVPQGSEGWHNPDPSPIPAASGTPRPTPTVQPRVTPSPTATPRATQTGDNSNAGVVNPRLFRQDNQANTEFWEQPRNNPNRPHVAMDFETTPNASVAAGATVPQYPATASVFDELPSYTYGEPSVQTPTYAGGSTGNIDTEPSLFDAGGTNPFDQWWKTTPDAPSVTVNAGDSGGSIWSGDDTLSNFGNDVALGNDLDASLASLGYGEDYPALESPAAESPFTPIAEGGGNEIEPDPLNQDFGDLEWTTSENDRRFLPQSGEAAPPPVPTRSLAGGSNLRDFGNNLSLGAFLNMPLASLRYGEGYPITYGGRPSDLQAEEGYVEPGSQTGGHWVDSPAGQTWVEDSPGSTEFIPEGVAVSPEVRRGELVSGPGQQRGPMSARDYAQATFGGLTPTGYRDTRGSATFDSRAANAQLMASQAFGGNAQPISVNDEERVTNSAEGSRFFPGRDEGARQRALRSIYPRGLHTNMGLAATGSGG